MNIYLHIIADYKYPLSDWLVREKKADRVFIPYLPSMGTKKIKCDNYVEAIPLNLLIKSNFEELLMTYNLPPLERNFMEEAKKYESMFIHIASHIHSMPVRYYDESKRKYYSYLKYWHNFFLSNNIGLIVFDDIPHWMVTYSAYIVAQILKIRVCILAPVGIRVPEIKGYIHIPGHSIETIGEEIEREYENIKDNKGEKYQLEGLIGSYFEKSINKKNESAIKPKERKAWRKYVLNAKYREINVLFPHIRVAFHNIIHLGSAIIKHHSLERYYDSRMTRDDVEFFRRIKLFRRFCLMSIKEYDKRAVYPDYGCKYILFPPQLWPEATTTPQAGCFSEQYNTIQMLSHITREFGVQIYVKEYYLQPYREKLFWDEIAKLENVKLIKSEVSSGELMEKAIAVACQTGTSLMEAPFYGIPALTLGGGFCLKGMPGLYEINTVAQGKKVIKEILEGVSIDKEELKKYFYSIQKHSIFFHRNPKGHVDRESEEYLLTLNELKSLISKEMLEIGMR